MTVITKRGQGYPRKRTSQKAVILSREKSETLQAYKPVLSGCEQRRLVLSWHKKPHITISSIRSNNKKNAAHATAMPYLPSLQAESLNPRFNFKTGVLKLLEYKFVHTG